MGSRSPVTAPPDPYVVLLPILRAAAPAGYSVGRTKGTQTQFIQLRADVQGHVTPISRYCRIGVTVWDINSSGQSRVDEAFDTSNVVVAAILAADHPSILSAEWQSGPLITNDPVSKLEVAYSTLLLEIV